MKLKCPNCGEVVEGSVLKSRAPPCPKCGTLTTATDIADKELREKREHEERTAEMLAKGIDTEWKAIDVGGWSSLFGGTFSSASIEKGLMKMASDGWEFVFFCDSAKAVGGPIMIFKRKIPSPVGTRAH